MSPQTQTANPYSSNQLNQVYSARHQYFRLPSIFSEIRHNHPASTAAIQPKRQPSLITLALLTGTVIQ